VQDKLSPSSAFEEPMAIIVARGDLKENLDEFPGTSRPASLRLDRSVREAGQATIRAMLGGESP
jgi:hypothetical protein